MHAECDRALAHTRTRDGSAVAHPRLVLATTILASSLSFVDGSVVNVALPAIARNLDAGGEGLSWIVNGYLLPLSALLLAGGAAGDLFGRRRLLRLGVSLFALASLLCAAAPSLTWLVLGRVLQGAGAAMLMPNSLSILGASFEDEARGRAIGTWAAAGAAAAAIGPLVGGWLVDLFGWRAMFAVNLPIAAATLVLSIRIADDGRAGRGKLDLAGAVLATVGLGSVTWGLAIAAQPQDDMTFAFAGIAAGAALLVAFVVVEKRRGDAAMMPHGLFASRSFTGLNVLTFLLYGALGGLFVLFPYVLIERHGYTAIQAGAALLPLPIVLAAASPSMGRLAARIGSRLPLTIGPVVAAAGFLLAMRVPAGASYWTAVLPALIVIAAGMAGAVAPLTTAVLSSAPTGHTGLASGFNSAVARTGGLIATALAAGILGAHGEMLDALFRHATVIGAAAAFAAGLSALLWVRDGRRGA